MFLAGRLSEAAAPIKCVEPFLAPQVGFEPTTLRIVAATDKLQIFRFPQSSRQGIVEFALVCSDMACQGKQVQAFRCYEHDPPTLRRLLTN